MRTYKAIIASTRIV